tara:strand:+ start:46 stop:1005 length:960 start_codon:yes stop_codon:yes gene_type:complete
MNILVTGGCGYVGSVLVPELIKKRYKVTVVDTQWFGNKLKRHKNLKNLKKDIRNIDEISLKGIDTVIHLAGIVNDPGADLNAVLSWEINVLATRQLIEKATKNSVKQFIYASSGSVYGVKKEKNVTENLDLLPISTYNKTKMITENVLTSFKDKIKIHCIRPATVCGVSPRMRFDVSVNILTMHALKKKIITVFGGKQVRPNIHIKDMADVYLHFLKNPQLPGGAYNAGFENISIIDIAKKIKKYINAKIVIKKSNDPRSYRQSSTKLLKTGFVPKYKVEDAIKEIIQAYSLSVKKIEKSSFTLQWMKKLKLHKSTKVK